MSLKVPCDVKSPQTTFTTGNIRAGSRSYADVVKTGALVFLQQTITMNENAQWRMIKDSVLFALSSGFSVSLFHFYLKKDRLEVYCSVFFSFFSLLRSLYLLLAYCLYWR
jgi:hypothetical protein